MKFKLYYGLILLHFFWGAEIAKAQTDTAVWAWVKSLSATNGIYGHAIAIDPHGSGEIYVAGGFEGLTDFDPGPGTFNLFSGANEAVGIFIAKYDVSSNLEWAKAMVGGFSGAASPRSIVIDPGSGAIYTTGWFVGMVDFDPGPNTFNLNTGGSDDIFFSKLDSEGNFEWAKRIGGPANDIGLALAIDPGGSGDVYITGQFRATIDFDPGQGISNITSAGNNDIFISKFNKSGEFIWVQKLGGPGSEISHAISFDAESGKIYTTGLFQNTVDFDPGPDTYNLMAEEGYYNFISKMDSSGGFVWAKKMGRVNSESDGSMALDAAGNGDVYTTGSFQDSCDFNPNEETNNLTSVAGSADIFISKLSESGDFNWARATGGTSQDIGTAIAIQPGGEEKGSVYTVGNFNGMVVFDPDSSGTFTLTSTGGKDIFISKLDSMGDFKWVKQIKGSGDEYVNAIAIDDNHMYLTGAYFGTSSSFDYFNFTNVNGGADLFFAKLDILVATDDVDAKAQTINLYPNPTTNELNIDFKGEEFFDVDIKLFNVLGEVVYFSPHESIIQKKSIDISVLTPGIYFVELNIDGNKVVEKVVKE